MCRNIRPLFNFDPPASEEELRDAALQYVRKISGMRAPSRANRETFEHAVDEITAVTGRLVAGLVTSVSPLDRDTERARARERWERRAVRMGQPAG